MVKNDVESLGGLHPFGWLWDRNWLYQVKAIAFDRASWKTSDPRGDRAPSSFLQNYVKKGYQNLVGLMLETVWISCWISCNC